LPSKQRDQWESSAPNVRQIISILRSFVVSATSLQPSKEIPLTETLKEELSAGSTFAKRYQIIEELRRCDMIILRRGQFLTTRLLLSANHHFP